MSTVVDTELALAVYERVFGESGRDERAPSIVTHLFAVAQAPSLDAAEKVISWWDCWTPNGPHNLRCTTRRLRKAFASHR